MAERVFPAVFTTPRPGSSAADGGLATAALSLTAATVQH